MKQKLYVISDFKCSECDLVFPLPRVHGQLRENNHIKDLYSPKCNRVQKFKEYKYKQPITNMLGEVLV